MGAPKGTKPWNAGTSKPYRNQRGYMCRRVNGREVKEHRFVMEQNLGRKLEPWEHVHHKDGDKTNNQVENLAVITAEEHNREHAGLQRSDSAKRTMAIYREMRMEIERFRSVNSEMLEALKKIVEFTIAHTSLDCTSEKCVCGYTAAVRAIAKAEGRES